MLKIDSDKLAALIQQADSETGGKSDFFNGVFSLCNWCGIMAYCRKNATQCRYVFSGISFFLTANINGIYNYI